MFLFFGTGFYLFAVCTARQFEAQVSREGESNQYQRGVEGYSDERLNKRSANIIASFVIAGRRAVKNLLNEATQVRSDSPVRQFIKSGGYEQAYKDFWNADPTNVQVFRTLKQTYGRIGDVGDKQIILRYNGQMQSPTLDIRKRSDYSVFQESTLSTKITDRITYLDYMSKDVIQ